MLVKQVMASPKSYSIWEHRVWTISMGLNLEREFLATMKAQKVAEKAAAALSQAEEEAKSNEETKEADGEKGAYDEAAELINMPGQEDTAKVGDDEPQWKSAILDNEMKLCSKMLVMDERNFHCWNYRNQMTNLYCNEIETRVSADHPNKTQALKNKFLQQECDMAKAIIQKNFSNYSAWHYRGKLIPFIKSAEGQTYDLPLTVITEDLSRLKHAYFTDPKDQSPWNYHAWLMSLLSPIQVVALQYVPEKDGKVSFTIGLSHQVKNFHFLDISLVDRQGNPIVFEINSAVPSRRSLSNSWSISLGASNVSGDRNSFTL